MSLVKSNLQKDPNSDQYIQKSPKFESLSSHLKDKPTEESISLNDIDWSMMSI